MSLSPPFLLVDRYEVTEEIGRGGHAVVYRARDRVLDREIAVKLLRADAVSEGTLARFRQEVQVTAQLEHAHILHVYDTGAFEGRPYIVMELATGRTLAERLEREGQLPVADALQVSRDIGLALAHAHARGIVHRDVKPENILLGQVGAILADFGIARVTQELLTQKITSTGTAVGTVQYMSPEQLCAEPNIDARSDQYSLACVLYEMLAGVRPHIAATFEGLRLLRMTGRNVPVTAHRPTVQAHVDAAIARALSPMPADRFRSVAEFLASLGVGASGEFRMGSDEWGAVRGSGGTRIEPRGGEIAGADGSGVGAGATPTGGRRVSRWAVLGAIGVVVLSVAGWFAVRGGGAKSGVGPSDGRVTVVLPRLSSRASDTLSVEGRVQAALRAELEAWPALRVAEKLPRGDSAAFAMALTIGAVGDSVRVRLDVRRSESDAATRSVEVLVPAREALAPAPVVAGLVRQALVREADSEITVAEAPGIEQLRDRSLPALRAYVHGFAALRAGELDTASSRFRVAATESKGFAIADFWAAQSGAWAAPTDVTSWRPSVERAVRSGVLRGVDSLLAGGLERIAKADFPAACAAYRQATTLAPESFTAWYQSGECQRLDSAIVQHSKGLRFRSSHWAALKAYREALERAQSAEWMAAMFPPVMKVTYAAGSQSRHGQKADSTHASYWSLPALSGDTIGMFPIPAADFFGMARGAVPRTWDRALRRGREEALTLTARWVELAPKSGDAWYYRARAMELAGRSARDRGDLSAKDALDRADQLASSDMLRAQVSVARTRLALRQGDLTLASRLARDATRSALVQSRSIRATLAPLAALMGDEQSARQLARGYFVESPALPAGLADSLNDFRVRALIGTCGGLDASRGRIETQFRVSVPPADLDSLRRAWLRPALRDAVPCLGVRALSGYEPLLPIDTVFKDIGAGDHAAALRRLLNVRSRRVGSTSAALTWDYLYIESWTLLEAGDSTGAREQLRTALQDIAGMNIFTLDQLSQSAGLRRGILLSDSLRGGRVVDEIDKMWAARAAALGSPPTSEKK